MLVHHTNPQRDRFFGRVDVYNSAVKFNGSFIGLFVAEQYFHKRRLACAVFSHKRMDLALSQFQLYVVICQHTVSIHFRDARHTDEYVIGTHR